MSEKNLLSGIKWLNYVLLVTSILSIKSQSYVILPSQLLLISRSLSSFSSFNLSITYIECSSLDSFFKHYYKYRSKFDNSNLFISIDTYDATDVNGTRTVYNILKNSFSYYQVEESKYQIVETLYNYQKKDMRVVVKLDASNFINSSIFSTSDYPTLLASFKNCLHIQVTSPTIQLTSSTPSFISILLKQQSSTYMLPFNLLSPNTPKVFANTLQSPNPSLLQEVSYTNEPFLPTFWNQVGNQVVAMPFLPYFSECTGDNRRIILGDLLRPEKCHMTKVQGAEQSFGNVQCSKKYQFKQCILQQLNVANPQNNPWWTSPNQNILSFHSQSLTPTLLSSYLYSSTTINSLQTSTYLQESIQFTSNLPLSLIPQQFVLQFNMKIGSDLNVGIESVELVANAVSTIEIPEYFNMSNSTINNLASLHVTVNYLTDFQRFCRLTYYIQFYLMIPLLIAMITYLLAVAFRTKMKYFQTKKLLFLIISPLLKGLIISMITAFAFTMLFYYISSGTNWKLIQTTYSNDSTGSTLLGEYYGRNGLVLIICGFFILSASIKQSFKVPTTQQMKIIIEDAQQQSHLQTCMPTSTLRKKSLTQQDISFSIKNLESRRNKIFIQFLFLLVGLEYGYRIIKIQTVWYQDMWQILGHFIIVTIGTKMGCYYLFKDLLFIVPVLATAMAHFQCVVLLKCDTLLQYLLASFTMIFSFGLGLPLAQIKFNKFCVNLYNNKKPNFFQVFLLRKFRNFLRQQQSLSPYQKGLYISSIYISTLCSIILIPFIFFIFYSTFAQNKIYNDLSLSFPTFICIIFMSILSLPLVIYFMLIFIQVLDIHYQIGIISILQLNKFQFKQRKVKWVSDIFRQNSSIKDYLQEFQKFHFSSQLYIVVFSMTFAAVNIMVGLKILVENSYVGFTDPGMGFIFIIVWVVGDIMSLMLSYIALKFKFYQKKEQSRMRTKLQSLQKYLKKNSYSKYLVLDQVKQHFLYTYKHWIVKNIQKILTKAMFLKDNQSLLKKFKFYKNLLKRKSLMKRNSIMMGQRQINSKVFGNSQRNLYKDDETDKRQIDDMVDNNLDTRKTIGNQMIGSKSSKFQQQVQARVIKLSKHNFTNLAKPILYYWFYTAKQNCFMKRLILQVKQSFLLSSSLCQFCSMDLDLQLIQKHDIQQLTNRYRVLNVGLQFIPESFISFYKTNQQFIITCFECKEKKLYLQKKKINNIANAKVILLNWFVKAKGRMLHRANHGESL